MRYIQVIYVAIIIFFGMLFYFMLLGINDHIYELEDRMVSACFLEVAGG